MKKQLTKIPPSLIGCLLIFDDPIKNQLLICNYSSKTNNLNKIIAFKLINWIASVGDECNERVKRNRYESRSEDEKRAEQNSRRDEGPAKMRAEP